MHAPHFPCTPCRDERIRHGRHQARDAAHATSSIDDVALSVSGDSSGGPCHASPMIRVSERITIPDGELSVTFARSGGPGGQNVNKVSSKAVLRWKLVGTTALPPDVRGRVMEAVRSRLTKEGELVIACDETRDQAQNLAIAEERIARLVRDALLPPKKRHKTKPSRGAKERRLKEKSVRAGHKAGRGRVRNED